MLTAPRSEAICVSEMRYMEGRLWALLVSSLTHLPQNRPDVFLDERCRQAKFACHRVDPGSLAQAPQHVGFHGGKPADLWIGQSDECCCHSLASRSADSSLT